MRAWHVVLGRQAGRTQAGAYRARLSRRSHGPRSAGTQWWRSTCPTTPSALARPIWGQYRSASSKPGEYYADRKWICEHNERSRRSAVARLRQPSAPWDRRRAPSASKRPTRTGRMGRLHLLRSLRSSPRVGGVIAGRSRSARGGPSWRICRCVVSLPRRACDYGSVSSGRVPGSEDTGDRHVADA